MLVVRSKYRSDFQSYFSLFIYLFIIVLELDLTPSIMNKLRDCEPDSCFDISGDSQPCVYIGGGRVEI